MSAQDGSARGERDLVDLELWRAELVLRDPDPDLAALHDPGETDSNRLLRRGHASDESVGVGLVGRIFKTLAKDGDAGEAELAGDMTQEIDAALADLDEVDAQVRASQGQGDARKSGTASEVGNACTGGQMPRGGQGVFDMTGEGGRTGGADEVRACAPASKLVQVEIERVGSLAASCHAGRILTRLTGPSPSLSERMPDSSLRAL